MKAIFKRLWLKLTEKDSFAPPLDVPLTDTPGKLLSIRLKYHDSGKIEVIETKLNLDEVERIKKVSNRWF